MAEVVKKHEFAARARYPWKEWFDGRIWKLAEGVDYTNANAFRVGAYIRAAKVGGTVTIDTKEPGFIFLVFKTKDGTRS